MSTVNLKNINIREKQDKNLNSYYLIIDKETDQVYFAFQGAVKEEWQELVQNWENLKEVELEYETNERGNNKVVSVYVSKEEEFLI